MEEYCARASGVTNSSVASSGETASMSQFAFCAAVALEDYSITVVSHVASHMSSHANTRKMGITILLL